MFRTYFRYSTRILKARLVYRAAMWVDVGFSFLLLLTHVYLWQALLGGGDSVTGVTFRDMATYVTLSHLITALTVSHAHELIEDRLKSGDISVDLVRPLSYRVQLLCADIG